MSDEVRWAAIQMLESWRRSGLSTWQHIAPAVAPVRTAPEAPPPTASPASASTPSRLANPRPLFQAEVGDAPLPRRATTAAPAPRTPFVPLDLSPQDRIARLAELKTCVAGCTRCGELARTRTQTVFGVGNPSAKILFIGEAPGADEDAQGEPFVGKAGQKLNDIIAACKLKREDIYICNVLRCRPPGNRLPAPEEAANCREWLDGQIATVNPEYIVCWGSCAAQNLLGTELAIGKLRGKFYEYGRAKVLCTYHPSYLLRNPPAKKDVWEDMKFLFRDMGIDLSAK